MWQPEAYQKGQWEETRIGGQCGNTTGFTQAFFFICAHLTLGTFAVSSASSYHASSVTALHPPSCRPTTSPTWSLPTLLTPISACLSILELPCLTKRVYAGMSQMSHKQVNLTYHEAPILLFLQACSLLVSSFNKASRWLNPTLPTSSFFAAQTT